MKKVLTALCLLFMVMEAKELPTLTINIGWKEPENVFIKDALKEIFKRAGMDVRLQVMPNKRSLINANSGIDDGEATRIWEINKYYSNLLPVPGQVFKIDIVAVTKENKEVTKVSDLSKYNVGVIHGMKIAVLMAERAEPLSLTKVTAHDTLLKMLESDRLDVALVNKASLYHYIDTLKGQGFYMTAKPLLTRPLYMQLHKKNEQYIPRLQSAIASMHADGTYQRIYDDSFAELDKSLNAVLMTLSDPAKAGD